MRSITFLLLAIPHGRHLARACVPIECPPLAEAQQSDDLASRRGQLSEYQLPLPRARPDHATPCHDACATTSLAFDPLTALRDALDVMQSTWFALWIGTWPDGIDWTREVINTHLVASLSSLTKALDITKESDPSSLHSNARLLPLENEVNQYFAQSVAYYFGENEFDLRYQAYDDMLWVVLGWLETIKFVNKHSELHYSAPEYGTAVGSSNGWHGSQFIPAFAHRARIFYELAASGWDSKFCGGGMLWSRYRIPYKNAITNELYITASVAMYLHLPGDNNTSPFLVDGMQPLDLDVVEPFDPAYLKAAVDGYDWLKNSNMTNSQGLYIDGFHISDWKSKGRRCDIPNTMVYSYNQGVLLDGLRDLWESTGEESYLKDGHQLVRNVMKATGWQYESSTPNNSTVWDGLGRNGILEEVCDALGHCSQDSQTFKGIFFHHLTLFCKLLPLVPLVEGLTYVASKELAMLHRQSCQEYLPWVAHNAAAAVETRDGKGKFGAWWGARADVDIAPLPNGAKDYRNDGSEMLEPLWEHRTASSWSDAVEAFDGGNILSANGSLAAIAEKTSGHMRLSQHSSDSQEEHDDLNDRGRGRTVETQAGGIAVLRALWELRNTPDIPV